MFIYITVMNELIIKYTRLDPLFCNKKREKEDVFVFVYLRKIQCNLRMLNFPTKKIYLFFFHRKIKFIIV